MLRPRAALQVCNLINVVACGALDFGINALTPYYVNPPDLCTRTHPIVGGVEERDEARALFELGPRDGVVKINVFGIDRPAVFRDEPLPLFGLDFH